MNTKKSHSCNLDAPLTKTLFLSVPPGTHIKSNVGRPPIWEGHSEPSMKARESQWADIRQCGADQRLAHFGVTMDWACNYYGKGCDIHFHGGTGFDGPGDNQWINISLHNTDTDMVDRALQLFDVSGWKYVEVDICPSYSGIHPYHNNAFEVVLENHGGHLVNTIKAVRLIHPGMGLKEAKELTEAAPTVVFKTEDKGDAMSVVRTLEGAGSSVRLHWKEAA